MNIDPDTNGFDFSKWTQEQFDRLARHVRAEQDRRNRILDFEIVIDEELRHAKSRILERLARC